MSDIYRDGPPTAFPLTPQPVPQTVEMSPEEVTRSAANIDRFLAVLDVNRGLTDNERIIELATLFAAAQKFEDRDVQIMFAIMLQRLADQP